MTMYAIAKKVTSPPRSSRPVVEPRSVIRKKRSSRPGAGPVPRASSFPAVSRRMPRRVTSLCPFLRYRSAAAGQYSTRDSRARQASNGAVAVAVRSCTTCMTRSAGSASKKS